MSTELDEREVEALAKLVEWAGWPNCGPEPGHPPMLSSQRIARMVLSREAALVKALEDAECELSSIARIHRARPEQVALAKIRDALRAHRASRQPSEPTLAEKEAT